MNTFVLKQLPWAAHSTIWNEAMFRQSIPVLMIWILLNRTWDTTSSRRGDPWPSLPLVAAAAAEAAWWFSWPAPAEHWPPRSAVWLWPVPAWPGSSLPPLELESLVPLDISNRRGVEWARQEVKRTGGMGGQITKVGMGFQTWHACFIVSNCNLNVSFEFSLT